MLKYIDLFSGIGGVTLGLDKLHIFNCVFASEISEDVKAIYRDNFDHDLRGDITKIKAWEIPEYDVLCACPPCQSFSIAGRRKGFDDPRGQLLLEVFRIADYHQPRVIFMENVPHILKVQGGAVISKIKDEFARIGYRLYIHNLRASDYGIPQARRRVYFVGVRHDVKMVSYEPPKLNRAKCVQDYLDDDADVDSSFFANKHMHCVDLKKLDSDFNIAKPLMLGNFSGTNDQTSRIFSTAASAATHLRTNANRTLYYTKYGNIRRLTMQELKRIMGFDGYNIPNENRHKKHLGNAIIPDMVEAIFKNIR